MDRGITVKFHPPWPSSPGVEGTHSKLHQRLQTSTFAVSATVNVNALMFDN
jgi:hypothetical protein